MSAVTRPCCSADRPYCTPTLSTAMPAKPWPSFFSTSVHTDAGLGANTLMPRSAMEQRAPSGLVCGL